MQWFAITPVNKAKTLFGSDLQCTVQYEAPAVTCIVTAVIFRDLFVTPNDVFKDDECDTDTICTPKIPVGRNNYSYLTG